MKPENSMSPNGIRPTECEQCVPVATHNGNVITIAHETVCPNHPQED